MKLTEEHIKALQLLDQMRGGKSSAKSIRRFEVLKEVAEILQKKQGIPWNDAFLITPPAGEELLVLAPDGALHLCSWRSAYNVFTVQKKYESHEGWQWTRINPIKPIER